MISEKVKEAIGPNGDFESHEDLKKTIEVIRIHGLLCGELGEGLDPEAEQFFLLALSALEQAERYAMLVEFKVRQERARTRGSWP